MTYTPNNWETGDTITAEKLNNMETGIVNAYDSTLVVQISRPDELEGNFILNKTWQEIYNAIFNTGVFIIRQQIQPGYEVINIETISTISNDSERANPYGIVIGEYDYVTNSPNGYPRTYIE